MSAFCRFLAFCFLLEFGVAVYATDAQHLVVGSEQDYPPFALGDTDESAGGFTVDLWKIVARDAGLNYRIRVLPFHELLEEFKQGKIDVLINLAQSESRQKFADFTIPHVVVHAAIFTRTGTRDINSESDLKNRSVIVVKADIAHEYAVSTSLTENLVLVPTAAHGMKLLASGQHDALLISRLVGLQTLDQLKLSSITALPTITRATQKFSFAVRKGDANLLAILNEGLAATKSSGKYPQLYHKWFGIYDRKERSPWDALNYILPSLALFAAFAIIMHFRRLAERRKATQQLAESHHMLQTVIETIPMRLFWKDRNFRYLGSNQLFAQDAGVECPENLIGKQDEDCAWREFSELYREDDRQVMESGQPKLAYEEPYTTPQGEQHWVRTWKTPLRALDGSITGVLGILYDITQSKSTEDALKISQAQLQSLFDNMTNGFAVHQVIRESTGKIVDYRFLDVNGAFERITGLRRANIIGRTAKEILPDLESYWIDRYANVVDTGTPEHLENYSRDLGRWFSSYAYRSSPDQFATMIEDITERMVAIQALTESEDRLSTILENVSAYIYLKDHAGHYLFANKMVRDLWGVTLEEIVGQGDEIFFDADTAANIRKNDLRVLIDGETLRTEETNTVSSSGETATYWSVKLPLRRQDGNIYALCGISTDITEVKRSQEQMLLATMVYENSSESMMITDTEGTIIAINPAFTKTTGYTFDEVRGKNPRMFKSSRQEHDFYEDFWHTLNTTGHWQGEIWDKRKNGEEYPKWLTINTTFDSHGHPYRRVALFSDISEKKKSEQLIWQQANFDNLTGLPNRRMFHSQLEHEIKKAHRNGQRLALMFIDLDRFKEINDTLGHDKGDLLLIQAANRLTNCVRESDTVARLGGDEFTIILGEIGEIWGIDRIANCLLKSLTSPFSLGEETAYISASLGITLYPDDADSADILIKNADQAMYESKHQGRNRYTYFTQSMDDLAKARLRTSNDLRVALQENQFWIAYQPIVEIATGEIRKAEALLRWQHPDHGLISPAEFIPIAEETGIIVELGNWVFLEATRQASNWRSLCDGHFQISINKSPIQFLNDGNRIPGWLEQLQESAMPASGVVVEITEGLLLDPNAQVYQKLFKFRDLGMQVAIDDFGTGYSSLAYLKKFDVDYLKIDRTFVSHLGNNEEDLVLCEAIIVMAHKLGIKVIAEGVETSEQLALLKAAGCDYAQGYYFSRPVDASAFDALLRQRGAVLLET